MPALSYCLAQSLCNYSPIGDSIFDKVTLRQRGAWYKTIQRGRLPAGWNDQQQQYGALRFLNGSLIKISGS